MQYLVAAYAANFGRRRLSGPHRWLNYSKKPEESCQGLDCEPQDHSNVSLKLYDAEVLGRNNVSVSCTRLTSSRQVNPLLLFNVALKIGGNDTHYCQYGRHLCCSVQVLGSASGPPLKSTGFNTSLPVELNLLIKLQHFDLYLSQKQLFRSLAHR
jgi:hypothetical protein